MSLYAGETVPKFKYDPLQGKPTKEAPWINQSQREKESYQELASMASGLLANSGWKVVAEQLQEGIDKFKAALLTEQDFEKIKRIQVAIQCYQSQLDWPMDRIKELESFQTRTSSMTGDNPQEEDNE